MQGRAGTFVTQQSGPEGYAAFVPAPLPPQPPINLMDPDLQEALQGASFALGGLDKITLLIPEPDHLISFYILKEAVLSNQIEGTQSSFSDVVLSEPGSGTLVASAETREVVNYTLAMRHGLERLRTFPLSLRLLREIHSILLAETRGGDKTPGEFRTAQNWIGGTMPSTAKFVPPPRHEMDIALGNLEKFIHDEPVRTPAILKAGIAHAQFETIHPFQDGNGRLGRLLITFLLCAQKVLAQPLLYLSLHLKVNRQEYYDRLQRVRLDGDWEGWLLFYLNGIIQVARQATETAHAIVRLFEENRGKLQHPGISPNVARAHDVFKRRMVVTIQQLATDLSISFPTASAAIQKLSDLGIVQEMTGKSRDRRFYYARYVGLLNEGTDTPAS
jgi:Fic family protein